MTRTGLGHNSFPFAIPGLQSPYSNGWAQSGGRHRFSNYPSTQTLSAPSCLVALENFPALNLPNPSSQFATLAGVSGVFYDAFCLAVQMLALRFQISFPSST
ncbi:hypothetical protein PAXRUDRAFT_823064 [Paxillus rubicundulus Ve08.2h10]|uniref:Uncharacterized protein n=1 Tax=Paxillus rubicundulus Ve08.2h10 TaxID=930991 RepID=A0A0D0DVV1_9AGAM|nr:hypothetical protein PAXRUDRAFT_823064 [Paxillus rubicundulus Ve08.2h10]